MFDFIGALGIWLVAVGICSVFGCVGVYIMVCSDPGESSSDFIYGCRVSCLYFVGLNNSFAF